MSQLTVNQGLIFIATEVNSVFATWQMGLFNTNRAPLAGDTLATYAAIEATFPGYARQPILAPTAPVIDFAGNATAVFPLVSFTCSLAPAIPETEFGWFLFDSSTGDLLAAGLFTTPQTITNTGDVVIVAMSDSAQPA